MCENEVLEGFEFEVYKFLRLFVIFLNLSGFRDFLDLKGKFKIDIGFGCLFLLLFEFWEDFFMWW